MDFIDQVKQFAKRVEGIKDSVQTEEATKTSIIMPFFALLGYDVFNPDEFVPEFTADVGIKKGEKVDYAIMSEGAPVILIECKWIGENLERHDSQLFRYFGTTKAKFAILTNGLIYRFYTDLEEPNKMDESPFLEINILDIKDGQVVELKKFHKTAFNVSDIFNTASELKYSNQFRTVLANELQNPSDDFLKFFLTSVYTGVKTQTVMEKFRPILKKSLNGYINELMSDKIKSALDVSSQVQPAPDSNSAVSSEEPQPVEPENRIVTTPEELEAYSIVKMLLKGTVPIDDLSYKDTLNYISILYQGKVTKWICRFILTSGHKILVIPDENKKEVRYTIESIYDIDKYKDNFIEVVKRYL
jgi:predicted type IV restriction endonuclease